MQLYSQVMYRALSELGEGGILTGRNRYQTNSMVEALLLTPNEKFIEAILYNENSASHTIQAIIDTYTFQRKFALILHFFKNKTQTHLHSNLDTFVDTITKYAPDTMVLEFLGIKEESEYYLEKVISGLYKNGRKDLANMIIAQYIPQYQQAIVQLIQSISHGEKISEDEIMQSIESLFSVEEQKDFSSPIMSRANQLIAVLKNAQYDIDILKRIYPRIKIEAGKREKFTSLGNYDLESQIREHLLAQEKYDEALEFIEICGDRHHYKVAVLATKMETGKLASQDAAGTIREICDIMDEDIEKLIEQRNKNLKNTKDTVFFRSSNKHLDRVDLYQAYATKYFHLVVYELLYGSKEKADAYMVQMIDWVEKIGIPGNPNTILAHHKWSMRARKRKKRDFREKFYHLGLLEHLPKNGGWSDMMHDPSLRGEKYEKKVQKKEEKHQTRENEAELGNILHHTDTVLAYMRLINEDKIDETLDLLKSETRYMTYTSAWIAASFILKKRPELFGDIFGICTRNLKDSYRGTEGFRGMEYFLLEAVQIGSFEKIEHKKSFMNSLQRACYNYDRGMLSLPSSVIYHVVDTLMKKGETQKAWDFYNFLEKEVTKGWSWQIIPDKAHDACMGFFIKAISKEDGGGISQAFQGNNPDLKSIEKIEYYNTKLELAYASGNLSKIEQERDMLFKSITTPLEAKKWFQFMALGTLRNSKQIGEELLGVLQGNISQNLRWRVIDMMIEHKVPDIFSLSELSDPEIPKKLLRHFFQKLRKKRLIHLVSEDFLKDEYLPYLQNFFRKGEKYFDFVMNVLGEMTLMDGAHGEKEISLSPRLLDAIGETESFLQEIQIDDTLYQQDVYKNIFSCMLFLCEKGFLQEGKKQKFIEFLEYVDIGFFASLCRTPELLKCISGTWNLSVEEFIERIIKRKVIGLNTFGSRPLGAMYTNIKTEKELQKFFKRYILKRPLPNQEDHISQSIQKMGGENITNEERQRNIQIINTAQKDFLNSKGKEGKRYRIPNLNLYDDSSRKLVIYCRHHQISPIDFTIVYKTVSEYVSQGKSPIFESVILVSREPNAYYPEYLGPVDYRDVQSSEFIETCSIYANTMHLTHGSCPDNYHGSLPILSASIRGDTEKMKDVEKYIPLYLNLDPRDHIRSPKGEKTYEGDYSKMSDEILRAIHALEEALLKDIK